MTTRISDGPQGEATSSSVKQPAQRPLFPFNAMCEYDRPSHFNVYRIRPGFYASGAAWSSREKADSCNERYKRLGLAPAVYRIVVRPKRRQEGAQE
ncbi:MAG: hypothetical protein ACOVN5_06935 [Aquidulcibacter sp.]